MLRQDPLGWRVEIEIPSCCPGEAVTADGEPCDLAPSAVFGGFAIERSRKRGSST